ncbi:MBL fold metallo-hydrolase [Larkinella soli]|uniref:MBL fold metallo-hydrolase n=1 Tax=Larkinella soli TaxID=1770527 RepID=UPI000FFB7DA8|nr:MBL fold metallo-hydrolase [Larkinella soli]
MRQLFITSLNSGSNGNCYYIGNEQDAVLVDAGISCRETEKRLRRLGLSMDTVRAIFISHEHSDHIRGVPQLARKYQLPVYITRRTYLQSGFPDGWFPVRTLESHEPVQIGDLRITAFPKLHDACDPHSFLVSCHDTRVGVFTDIGQACEQVVSYFSRCHAAFLEANYDEDMLESGRYPYYLKRRIRGGMGHLSNRQALDLFRNHKPSYMSHVLLSHLSKENNCPVRTRDLFSAHQDGTEVIVASRFEETPVFTIRGQEVEELL